MKIFKSIKWRLQIWYGLILVAVLAGLGFTAYQLERNRQFGRVDDDLHRRFGVIANALRPVPRGPEQNFNGPPPGGFPEDGPPEENQPRPGPFRLPPEAAGMFGTNDANQFYYVVWNRDGREVSRSDNVPPIHSIQGERPEAARPIRAPGQDETQPGPAPQMRGMLREIEMQTPRGDRILIGCSIAPELKNLRQTGVKLSATGGLILLVGLAGGWFLVSRAIRPIEQIGFTAAKISAGDLSQRINVAEAESELGRLAVVLNSTFARLEAAFAQQKQFASDAAHELRTPVSVMLTQTQMALNRERSAPEYRETLEACQRAAQRMRRLIGSLLELARLDAGQEQMKRIRFDLAQTAQDCVELIRPLADERQVKVIAELKPLECAGDSERLAQVITNLLTNAIQYNRPEGEVRVSLQAEAGFAVLKVADTGQGIAAENLPHVFERFYRADKSRTSGNNTGLGLAIGKAIVDAHGGAMEVASEEGVGTTFTVRLPV